ncbi:hypothetical protein SKAU_G00129360 [Synaphobranchus kaupii]|uniref:Reverse transcriptase n=1 Tax=Synaphobranchus kaupii TaxID=118154 RepID=A0A9Q1FQ30_SYNKA|nr:hypothetical protein SKAU_G00129360 [Synaphobranchus kaupii]
MSASKESNAVINYMHGETPMDLHCDNCSGQNKNNFVLWYCAWWTMHSLHQKLGLLIAGPTKFGPDNDVGLLSHKQQHAQSKLTRLSEEAVKTGLKINVKKTEVIRINKQELPIQLQGENIKETDRFTYLGSIAVLLYGSETWRVTNITTNKLQTFINRCLRHILNIRWPEKISNANLWERTNQNPISQDVKKQKWGWIGHTLRKPADVTRQALDWNPQGKRRVGRPKQTWRRSVDSEAKTTGLTWTQLKKTTQNRVHWWCGCGPMLHLGVYGNKEINFGPQEAILAIWPT